MLSEIWDHSHSDLEYLKGEIKELNNVVFDQESNIVYWTVKGVGVMSLSNMLEDWAPYSRYFPLRSMYNHKFLLTPH